MTTPSNASALPSTESVVRRIDRALPAFEHFRRRTEPDSYGASALIADALDKDRVPRSFASWKHGWPHAKLVHPVQLAEHGGPERTHLVPRPDHVQLLRDFGYPHVHAMGLPFVYAEARPVERISDSLLVMPPHTLPHTDENWDEEQYVDAIARLKTSFSTIVACVHRYNIRKGQWIDAFEDRGIEWVPGAHVEDRNGLVRMHTLFSMFEYVTTNTIGSHIPYAAYCGCKVSIYGPFSEPSRSDYRNDPTWSQYPGVLDVHIESSSEEAVRQRFPFLFVSPSAAETHTDWARTELGAEYRRPPQEIAWLLGWAPVDQLREYAAYLTTADAFANYAQLVRNRLARAAVAVRDRARSLL
jgi:hypothetical protein